MKKSFLITLAAVSSVALIGCSSDDSSKGPDSKPGLTIKAYADKVASTSAYVVYNLSATEDKDYTLKGKLSENINQIKCTDGVDSDLAYKIDDATKTGKIGFKTASLGEKTIKCTLGSSTAPLNGDTTLTFSKANNIAEKIVNAYDDANPVSLVSLTAGDKAKELTLKLEAGATYADENLTRQAGEQNKTDKVVISVDGDIKTKNIISLAGCTPDLEGKAGAIADTNCKLKVNPTEAANGKVNFAGEDKATFGSMAVEVKAKTEGGGQGGGTEPAANYDTKTSTTSKVLVAEIINIPASVKATAIECASTLGDSSDKAVVKAANVEAGKLLVGAKVNELGKTNTTSVCTITIDEKNKKTVTVDFKNVKTIEPIKLEDITTPDGVKAFSKQVTVGETAKIKATLQEANDYDETSLAPTKFAGTGITHVVVAKQDLSAVSNVNFAVAGKEATPDAETAFACTTAQLGQASGCEFALKAKAKTENNGVSALVFNGADNDPNTNKKYSVEITAK